MGAVVGARDVHATREVDPDRLSAPGLVRHVEVAPEAAADVEHELSAERLDGERAAQVAAEVRAPLARELRPRRPEVEPPASEALERVGERVVGRGPRRRQLGMTREEVRVAPRDAGEERRADRPRHTGDDREARPAPRAGERPLFDSLA